MLLLNLFLNADVVVNMEATEIGDIGIALDPPLEDGRGTFLGLGLVPDPVQGKQADSTRLHQVQLLVQALQYQVCVAMRLMLHLLGLKYAIKPNVLANLITFVLVILHGRAISNAHLILESTGTPIRGHDMCG
jgi:hypothetical protein